MRRYYLGPYADTKFRQDLRHEARRPLRIALAALPLCFALGLIVERYLGAYYCK